MLPSLFLCHGSPFLAVAKNDYAKFLTETGSRLKPKAILIFSAHWEQPVTTVSFAEGPLETIYDFWGFPDELYRLNYPAPGSPEIAEKVEACFHRCGIPSRRDFGRGLDHGGWVILKHMYPEANIPVVSVSVYPFLSAEDQLKIGEALRGLGEEGILVIGSGTTVHNFNEMKFNRTHPESWAVEFDNWLIDKFTNRDTKTLLQYERLAPHRSRAVPRAEHFVPVLHAYGSSSGTQKPKVLYRGYEFGTFSHLCFEF